MNKHDLLETGMRLIGVWISASGLVSVLSFAIQVVEHGVLPSRGVFLLVPIELFLGLCLLFLSPGFVRWMRAKDERVDQATTGEPASQEIF